MHTVNILSSNGKTKTIKVSEDIFSNTEALENVCKTVSEQMEDGIDDIDFFGDITNDMAPNDPEDIESYVEYWENH